MLNHLNDKITPPKRVVILGAAGFVGSTATKRLLSSGIDVLTLGREDIDLLDSRSVEQLRQILRADDSLVIVSAKAPCKNYHMLLDNIQMMKHVCDALLSNPARHVIYISSDAVYTDSMEKLNESSPAAPGALHGAMHLAREQMLQSIVAKDALAILRPSLLYGANDPHNGYGPNSFYRLATSGQAIELFGQGEEERDHVYIEDVAELIYLCLTHGSHGILNITTGQVTSFAEVANLMGAATNRSIEIKSRPRTGPMPHNGYRAFDNTICQQAFSGFQYTSLKDGLKKMHEIQSHQRVV